MNIKNMKLKYRLAGIYLLTAVLPVIVLFTFSYGQMKHILIERDTKSIQNFVNQAGAGIDTQLEVYNNLSNYITFNETISRVVSYDYKSDYEMYDQLVLLFDPMLSSLKYFHEDVKQVTIYAEGTVKHDTTLAPLSEIEAAPWFDTSKEHTTIQWFADSSAHTLSSARKMSLLYQKNKLGILYISVDYDKVFEALEENTQKNYGIYIVDSAGSEVYEFHSFTGENVDKALNFADFCGIRDGSGDYTVISTPLATTDWTIYMYEPTELIIQSAKPMMRMIFVAVTVIIAGAVLALISTSRFLIERIELLQHNMQKVEQGDFTVRVHSDSNDEIGALINGFDHMVSRISTLITEVYEGRIHQKEYEMRALRAQINPHFLYNSLSLINWKAIESGQEDISRITLELSNYYRTSLNKGRNTLTLEQELSNVRSYLQIQQLMHDGDFDVEIDVAAEILQYESLNLILQPLVENAIDHGIDLKTEGRGRITIRGWQEPAQKPLTHRTDMESDTQSETKSGTESRREPDVESGTDYLVVLTVSDNGVGMDTQTAADFLTVQSGGYGARNVNERLKLYYGDQYPLKVDSKQGEGTTITITFPARVYTTQKQV